MARKILLADDSITIQKVVELTFSDGDYEVTAVNNGARAIQKLSEMRPDIILSDIIMPEKNGYEVCEYVKSHPDYRTIPVILLTGTFEPFDPDRADQAGCDAVVTKPFESQSLIHKVDELIEQAHANAAAAVPPPPPAPEPEPEPAPSPWSAPEEHGSDIFAAPEEPAETRALPMMQFDELQRTGETAMPPMESNPWDDTAEAPVPHTPPAPMPWDEPTAERPAFHESESTSPWDEPAPPSFEAETRAFPKMSYEELSAMSAHEEPAPPTPEQQAEAMPPQFEPSPWDEAGAWSPASETPAIDEPTAAESFSTAAVAPFEESPAPPAEEETPFAMEEPAPPMPEEPLWAPQEAAPIEAAPEPLPPVEPEPQPAFEAPPAAEEPAPAPAAAAAAAENAFVSTDLTDEQVDRIARRVVQLMSEQVVKNIAWEVIPDLAEMVVKERIRELEGEG